MSELAAQQEALVRALVADGPVPAGFDLRGVAQTREALLRKRAGYVAAHWPALGAQARFTADFATWAAGRPPSSAHEEGLAYAGARGSKLSPAAKVELLLAGHRRFARDVDGLLMRALGTVIRLPLRRRDSAR
jgi:pimeloyl-ACP methyl ester carboxylesterase